MAHDPDPDGAARTRYLLNLPRRVPLGYEERAGDKQFATTLARGIELLRCFTAADAELSNGELSARSGLPRPTVSRLTYTLTALGYLRQNPRTGRYGPGPALVSAAYPLLASLAIRRRARPLMDALAEATGGRVSMGIRDRLDIVVVETSRPRGDAGGTATIEDVGLTTPIAGSSCGFAYLAALDAPARDALVNAIRVKSPDDWARYEPILRSALREHARSGFCAVDGSLLPEVLAVGAHGGALRGGDPVVFNCSFDRRTLPAGRGLPWLRREIGPRLAAMVARLRAGMFEV